MRRQADGPLQKTSQQKIATRTTELAELFSKHGMRTAQLAGHPLAFLTAVTVVLVWALSGPLFGYSDTWQLVINTSTTIVTFLMVFLIQHTQNRDTLAVQLKLAELIIAVKGAENRLATAEDLSEEELEDLHEDYRQRAEEALDHLKRRRAQLQAGELTAALAQRLGMHVLGEPVGRQFVAEAALLRLAVDHGAGGGELIAEPDIVDEAGDLVVRLCGPATRPTIELGQGRQLLEIDLARRSASRGPSPFPRSRRPAVSDMDRRSASFQWMTTRSARLSASTSISGRLIELTCMPGSIQRSKKMWSMELRGAHHDVGAPDRLFRLRRPGSTSTPSSALICCGECFAISRIGAEAADGLDVAHGAGRHELRARLPAGAEDADGRARPCARDT